MSSVTKAHITVHISQKLKCFVNWSLPNFILKYEICLSLYKTVHMVLLNPIPAGGGGQFDPPPVVFFYITQKVLV